MIIVWIYDEVPEEECYIGKKISTHEELCNASIPESEKQLYPKRLPSVPAP